MHTEFTTVFAFEEGSKRIESGLVRSGLQFHLVYFALLTKHQNKYDKYCLILHNRLWENLSYYIFFPVN